MPLDPGQRLGPYTILGLLGKGGMGEVYRANDPKLGRDVAIKVLPEALALDANFMSRFEREARVLASLNHPRIAQIYGLESNAIVMELVEGPTLEDKIGQLDTNTAIEIARQIAEAFDAAHEKGIVHRDLKPANVKLTPTGDVKVLDFGLAKTAVPQTQTTANSPTLTLRATEAGLIMGTAAYMAPEQARAQDVDKRADIWAFGVVLFEMLTGKRLFEGATVSDILARVLTHEPDFTQLPRDTPANVIQLLKRCLQKDPRKRLRDIGDAWTDAPPPPPQPGKQKNRLWPAVAAVALIALAVALLTRRPPEAPVTRLSFVPPANALTRAFAVSPDGRSIAFNATTDGKTQIWVRKLDRDDAQPVPGTEGVQQLQPPVWSPNGEQLAFHTANTLTVVSVVGNAVPVVLSRSIFGRGIAWSKNGIILFPDGSSRSIFRVPATGGKPEPITRIDPAKREGAHRYPFFLPDGNHFLFINETQEPTIEVASLDGRTRKVLFANPTAAQFLPNGNGSSGHVLFVRDQILFAQDFDAGTLTLSGNPVPIANAVGENASLLQSRFSVSNDAVAVGADHSRDANLVLRSRTGEKLRVFGGVMTPTVVRLSPDGSKAYVNRSHNAGKLDTGDIFEVDLVTGSERPLLKSTPDIGFLGPVVSPDGQRILYSTLEKGRYRFFESDLANGIRREIPVDTSANPKADWFPISWSPRGNILLHSRYATLTGQLGLIKLAESLMKPEPITPLKNHPDGTLSPDGHWLAYASGSSRNNDASLTVEPFPPTGAAWQVATGDSQGSPFAPEWRRDGKELFFSKRGSMQSVSIDTSGPTLHAGQPKVLFSTPIFAPWILGHPYAASPDGQRFLVAEPAEPTATPIHLILNWRGLLKKQ